MYLPMEYFSLNDRIKLLQILNLSSLTTRPDDIHYRSHVPERLLCHEVAFAMLFCAGRRSSILSDKQILSIESFATHYDLSRCSSMSNTDQAKKSTSLRFGEYLSFDDIYSDDLLTSTLSRCSSGVLINNSDRSSYEVQLKVPRLAFINADESEKVPDVFPLSKHSVNAEPFACNGFIWNNIFSYLTWQDVLRKRRISKFHYFHSLPFACITRMPSSKSTAVFIPCREDLNADEMLIEKSLSPQFKLWTCPRCGILNAPTCICCTGYDCNRTRPLKGTRIFLGQLRRSGTVAMVRWLLTSVLNVPSRTIFCVENHRNVNTGHGKGSSWVTITDETYVLKLLHANHRMFFDHVYGVEGVWIVPRGSEKVLEIESEQRNEGRHHLKYMPRGVIVLEPPNGDIQLADNLTHSSLPPPPYDDSSRLQSLIPTRSFINKNNRTAVKVKVWYHNPYEGTVLMDSYGPHYHCI